MFKIWVTFYKYIIFRGIGRRSANLVGKQEVRSSAVRLTISMAAKYSHFHLKTAQGDDSPPTEVMPYDWPRANRKNWFSDNEAILHIHPRPLRKLRRQFPWIDWGNLSKRMLIGLFLSRLQELTPLVHGKIKNDQSIKRSKVESDSNWGCWPSGVDINHSTTGASYL